MSVASLSTTSPSQSAVYFVDSSLGNLDALLAAIPGGANVVLLDPNQDGLAQISTALDGLSNIDALHIVTHGAAGNIHLGSSVLNADTLAAASHSLQSLGEHLSNDADILFYGCDVAANDAGKALINQIADLTGADVAASTDLTGASSLGGDWELEASTGAIEASGITAFNFDGTLALPGAHSATQGSEVFLGGNYIELGISSVGSFGTSGNKPGGFYGTTGSNAVGMSNDADGFGNGVDLRIDYFLPGTPEERWAVGYNGSTTGGYSALAGSSGAALSGTSLTNLSSGDTLSAKFAGTVGGVLKVEQTHSFTADAKFFKTVVTLTNTSGSTLTDVRFMRSFDPDNTVYKGGSYSTTNKVENTIAADGKAVVSATSAAGDTYNTLASSTAKILFFSSDSRANVANFGFSNSDPYAMPNQAKGYSSTSDSGIAIMFKGGTLAAGSSVTFEYFTSLDTADVSTTIAQIEQAANPAPTFTAFAAPVDTVAEDTQVEITYADLAAQGNEADQKPNPSGGLMAGSVTAFVVTNVTSGTLKIGSDAGSATAWNPGVNDVIDATHKAYWTPASNANGTLNAFKVVARDEDGLKSSTPVQAQVSVTPVNDAPLIASATTDVALPGINEDQSSATNAGATVNSLFAPRFTDVDSGSSMSGIVVVGDASTASEGKWQYSTDGGTTWYAIGTVASDNGLALSATTKLRFSPTSDWNGTPGKLTVYLTDDAYAGGFTNGATRDTETSTSANGLSTNTVHLGTSVASVNDLPYFTSAAGAASLTETAAYDNAVTTASGALNGTLAGSDVEDGSALTFGIRGGSTSGSTVTKTGFYGTLTLDTSTKAWTYTPGNFTAINALGEGKTATDTFEFSIVDSNGGTASQTLTVTYTGTNDLPVVNSAIADTTFNGNGFNGDGIWSYQIPADAFTDAEGGNLTYTIEVVDGSGNVIDTIGATTTSGDSSKPSNWLIFNETSRTFSGTPTATAPLPLNIKVTASDGSASVSDTFTVTLVRPTSDANPTPDNVAPITTDDHVSTTGTTPITLSVNDFGNYHDANGDALASVKIISPPSGANGTLKLDGVAIAAANTEITKADIDAGKLTFTPSTNPAAITFQVSDGSAFSSDHTLTIDVGSETGVTFAASDVSTTQANTWTNVYSANPLNSYSGTVRVVVEATGGTVKLANASGVTSAQGYGNLTDGSATSIAFEGSQAQVNAALQQLQANLAANPKMTLAINAIAGGSAYNPDNQHYYKYVEAADISWTSAKGAAESSTFNGLKGYLATITSAEENAFIVSKVGGNAWIGASDAAVDGDWTWVGGPEKDTVFFHGIDGGTSTSPFFYTWQSGEPNGTGGKEDYAQIITVDDPAASLVAGKWNDLADTGGNGSYAVTGYVIEYGGSFTGSGSVDQAASRTITLTKIPAAPVISIGGDAAYTENAAPKALNPALALIDVDSTTLASATVSLGVSKVTGDLLAFVNDNASTYGNILGTYDSGTGVLTLSSASHSATLAQWEAALKAVTFASTSDNPGTGRTLSWQVKDGDNNASNVGSTAIAVTPVNDAPIATKLPDQTLATDAAWSFDIDGSGNNLFTDPEGQAIAYSATLANGDPLPSWLSFDTSTHTFSGNPPAGTPYLNIKVIGTDASGAAGFTTFTLNLTPPDGDAGAGAGAGATNSPSSITIADTNGGSIALGDVLTANAPVDGDGYVLADVKYQWQVSSDSGSTWSDIGGATSSTYTLTQTESSKQVRAQAFYTDKGGYAEAPVSTALAIPTFNVAGTVTVNGSATPGETLVASLSDGNGIVGVTPTYQWYRGDTTGALTTAISGATFSSYTLTDADGGKYVSVKVIYTDNEGSTETRQDSTDSPVQLGAVAPVAVNDTGIATEAGGVDNAAPGSNATGNVLLNDTDANSGDTKAITGLRSGNDKGLGEIGLLDTGEYSVSGEYGTLHINAATGAYTYTVNQAAYSVQALNTGDTIKDYFNYTVTDSTLKSDIGVLEITINGANDAISVRDVPTVFTAVEDQKTSLVFPLTFALNDPDNSGTATVKLVASEGKLSAASSGGVTVSGNDSGTLTLTGTLSNINAWLKTADKVSYTSSPNDNGTGTASITLKADDGASGDVTLATVNVDVTATNDAPRLDLNANNSTADGVDVTKATGADLTGNDYAVVFRPRGTAVKVVDDDIAITDIDGDTTLVKATVEITAGAWDNSRTIYETLSSTAGSAIGGIAITGNGTGANGLTGATKLTLTGSATHAQYQDALKTIVYNNSNENAFAGNRSVTIAVFDKAAADGGLESNSAAFTIAAANGSVAVGQKIYIAGVDTGKTVATVIDSSHFVASGSLPTLADTAAMSFWLDGTQVTTAVAKAQLAADGYAPSAATTVVQVLWTPVVDLNGNAASGSGYTTSYTEGNNGTYITSTDAVITDQDGNLQTVTVTLKNAADTDPVSHNSTETLFMATGIVSNLSANGITTTFYDASNNAVANATAGVHKIVFSGNKDATTFQLGIREVEYKNTSENPSITPRTVTVDIVDHDGNNGVSASTTVNIVPVNDAPMKGGDFAGALNEGGVYVFTTADLNSTDVDNAAGTLKYVLTSTPAQGTLFRDTNGNGVVDAGEAIATVGDTSSVGNIKAIGTGGYFTQAEVAAGTIKYAHNGNNPTGVAVAGGTGTDTFGFKVVDGMEDYAFANIAANQAGTVTLTVTEVNDAATGAPVVSGTMTPGLALTADVSSIHDADGPVSPTFSYQWMVNDGTGWSNATGAGSTTGSYTLAGADQGKQVKVVVSFNDAFGRSNVLEGAASGTVAFTNTPGSGGVTITNDGTPQAGEILTANTGSLTDADGLGPFSYQWQVSTDGGHTWTSVGGATGKTYTLPGNATTGAQYKAVVSYTDGRGNSENIDSTPVTVAAPAADVNDAPSLTGNGNFPATTALFSGVSVTTVESGQTIKALTLTVGGLQDGTAEKLTIDGVAIALDAAGTTALTYPTPAPAGSVGGVSYAIAIDNGTATVTLTHTGFTEAQVKALVEGLTYNNTAVAPTAGLRVVTLTSLQDSGGTASGGQDTGTIGISATVDVGNTLNPTPPTASSNTAPTVSGGDLAGSVDEGGTMTLTTTDLSASDTEQPGLKVVLDSAPTHGTLFRDTNNNGIVDAGETLTTGSNFALADIDAGRIKYAHDGSEATSDSFAFKVSDGLAQSGASTFNITVTPVNDLPTLSATALGSTGTPVAFTEGDAAKAIFSSTTASAVETAQKITDITVMVSGLRDGLAEKLTIDDTEIALTQGTNGTTGSNSVGYSVTVTGGTAIVTLSKDTNGATWNGLIDGLAYRNSSETPTAGDRSLTLTKVTETSNVSSDVAITSHVTVTPVNDAPTLALSPITVQEGGSLTLDTTLIHAADVDSPLSSLAYKLSSAPAHGTVYIDANGNGVQDDGEALTANGTFTYAQLSSGKVRYVHDGGETGDSFGISVSDGQGGTSGELTMSVTRTPVNDAPTISYLGSDILTYPANSGAKTLEQGDDVEITDPDSSNFSGGNLRVSITFNRDPGHDVLSIANVGAGVGQIGISGGNVTYGGTTIGTVTGGTGTNDLLVSFNSSATPAAVSALVKAIQFSNDQAAPANTSRTVSFALNDGSTGGQAKPVAVNVNLLTGVTPSISIGNGFFVMENTQLVTALSATDPNSRPITFSISGTADSANNPDNGTFEIVSGNLLRFKAAPDYEHPTDNGTNNVYNVIVRATNDLGSYVEQSLAITVLNQDPEDGIAVGDTSGPVFGYATVNGTSLVMTYTDASNLSTANLPATSAFSVKVGSSNVAVTNVAVNAASKTVTLTLGSAVTAGQSVTVAYADPTAGNDVAALQDAAGNDAATLADTTVTNITPSAGGGSGGGSSGGGTSGGSSGGGTGGGSTGGTGGGTTTVTDEGIPVTTVTQPGVNGTSNTTQTVDPITPPSTDGGNGGSTPTQYTVPLAVDGTGNNLIQVGLPGGVGIQSITTEGSNLTLRQRLVGASNPLVNNDAEFTQIVQNGIDKYVPTELNPTGVTVRALTLTVPSGTSSAPSAPVLITGNTSAPSALVIDARQLPSGTKLQVNDVTFAVVIGAAHLSGGAGQNYVVGDDNAQYIVLGADDDILHGGGGNDTVGSLGGNDATFGDNGNDIVFGGTGNDQLSGGAGNDKLNGGLGYDVATQSGILSDYKVSVDGNAVVLTNINTGEQDRLLDVERVDFVSGPSLTIAYSEADAAAQYLATTWLGRNLTAEEGAAIRSSAGVTAEQIAADFLALPISAPVRDKSIAELLAGMNSDPNILRLHVADHYYGNATNEMGYLPMGLGVVIDGGGGYDVLQVAGQLSDFHVEGVKGTVELTRLSDGAMYSLKNTEMIAFDSGERVVLAETRDDAILARLCHTMLGRGPTVDEWKLGPQAMDDYYVGRETKESIFAWFYAHSDIDSLNNSDYVQRIYTNTYGRKATDAELSDQLHRLSSGDVDRDWLAVEIASSAEAVKVIGSVISVSET